MSRQPCATSRTHTVATGLMFLVTGLALLGVVRDWWVLDRYWAFWPLVFVLPALGRLAAPAPDRQIVAGLAWLALAVGLVLLNLGYVHLRIRDLVPLLLVGLGARLIWRARTETGRSR